MEAAEKTLSFAQTPPVSQHLTGTPFVGKKKCPYDATVVRNPPNVAKIRFFLYEMDISNNFCGNIKVHVISNEKVALKTTAIYVI